MIETIPNATLVPKTVDDVRGGTGLVINATFASDFPTQQQDEEEGSTGAWAQLSVASFARDWDSPEDSVYDNADLL